MTGFNPRGHEWGAPILGARPGVGACGLGKMLLGWGSASSQAFTDLARVTGLEEAALRTQPHQGAEWAGQKSCEVPRPQAVGSQPHCSQGQGNRAEARGWPGQWHNGPKYKATCVGCAPRDSARAGGSLLS